MARGGDDGVSGELAEGVVPGLLKELYVGRRNGTLHFVKGSEEQSVHFHRGHIVNARTNVMEERLGEILVRHDRLSQDDLARATEVVVRDKKRLGEVLLELNLLDEAGLEDAVALRVHEMLAKVFTWNEGTYSFEEEEEEEEAVEELTLRLSTGELILEAVRAIRDPDVVRYALGDMDRVLALSSDPLLRFQQLPLSPDDGFVLSRVDGSLTAREIEQMIPISPKVVRRSLLGLLSTGVIEYTATPAQAPTEDTPDAAPATGDGIRPEEASAETEVPPPPPGPDAHPGDPRGQEGDAAPSPAEQAPISLPAEAFTWPAAEGPTSREAAGTPADAAAPDAPAAERRREIEAAWEGLRAKNHFEILGLTRKATAADVKGAYFSLARRFHPDVHHEASLGDLRDKLEAVFIRLGEAYEILRDRGKRSEYEERLGRPRRQAGADVESHASNDGAGTDVDAPAAAGRAEEAVGRAERLYVSAQEAGKDVAVRQQYWEAIQLVEPIFEGLTGRLRLRGRLVLARCYLENPNWVRRAEETLRAAVREEPGDVDAYRLLARLYEDRGLPARATSMYRRALELKPDDAKAREALARLGAQEEPPPEKGSGFLSKMFRRS